MVLESSLPKGVTPIVPIIIADLTTGSNEQCENAVYAIADLVERRNCHQAIRRAIHRSACPGRNPSDCLSARRQDHDPARARCDAGEDTEPRRAIFLMASGRLKSVSDSSSIVVRMRSVMLMHSQPRVDPMVTELIGGARGSKEEIAASFLLALFHVVRGAVVYGGRQSQGDLCQLGTRSISRNA